MATSTTLWRSAASGSTTLLRIGTFNSGGVRGREQLIASLGGGIWNLNETHLSKVTMPAFAKQFRYLQRQSPQDWRGYSGHPVPLRHNSSTAGCRSGVAQVSAFPGRPISLSWPHGEYTQGRIQVTQFDIPAFGGITGVNLYGWPSSPTWPHSRRWTNRMLQQAEFLIKGHQGRDL